METLDTLQKKIEQLLELVAMLKDANKKLVEDNESLAKQVDLHQSSLERNKHEMVLFDEEKNRTKIIVDDIIKNIDLFMHAEQ